MNNIIFITGMAGAGKSTVGYLVARHFPKCIFIRVDELRGKMVKGYAIPEAGVFTEEAMQQFQMARSTAIYMARLYAHQGVDVVIDDVCAPANFVEQYAALFEIPEVHRVLLYPKAPIVIERINNEVGPWSISITCLRSITSSTRCRKMAGLYWTQANGRLSRQLTNFYPT